MKKFSKSSGRREADVTACEQGQSSNDSWYALIALYPFMPQLRFVYVLFWNETHITGYHITDP